MRAIDKKNIPALAVLYFALLFWHTWLLYHSRLNAAILFLQAFYRFLVAVAPLLVCTMMCAAKKPAFYLWMGVFIMIIPYPLYNFFQLRHIAEILPVQKGQYVTQTAHTYAVWKIIPVSVYAWSQLIIFLCCLQTTMRRFGTHHYLLAALVCFLSSLAVTTGLDSRLDTFHLFTEPGVTFGALYRSLRHASYLLNTLIIFCFTFFAYAFSVYREKRNK